MRGRLEKADKRGFTLIDMSMVTIVITILVTIAIPRYLKVVNKSRVTPQLALLQSAIYKLHAQTGQWPHGETAGGYDISARNVLTLAGWKGGAAGLLTDDASNPYPFWGGPYIEGGSSVDKLFIDPWGNPIFFDGNPETEPGAGQSSIASGGPNGAITSFNRADKVPQDDDIIVYLE